MFYKLQNTTVSWIIKLYVFSRIPYADWQRTASRWYSATGHAVQLVLEKLLKCNKKNLKHSKSYILYIYISESVKDEDHVFLFY